MQRSTWKTKGARAPRHRQPPPTTGALNLMRLPLCHTEGCVIPQYWSLAWKPKVMIRSDNEPALLQVVDTALTALKMKGVTSSSEGSVPYDPQTNGAVENAVRLLKGSLRANLLSFERQLQARIPVNHPTLAWLVMYAASVRTMRVRGPDGRTSHQLARGSGASIRHPLWTDL